MNELEQFYEKLNGSDYDCRSNHTINSELQAISQILNEKEDFATLEISELERQAFSISKSFDRKQNDNDGTIDGLGWKTAGKKTFEDGTTEPFYWPDVRDLQEKDFQYFEDRYKSCRNLYSKTEFGLLVYFGGKTAYSKHTDFKKQLFNKLYSLSQQYLENAKNPSDKKHYILDYFTTLKNAFLIAYKSKLKEELDLIIESIYETHQTWDVTLDGSLRVLLDLSGLTSEYYKTFKTKVDYDKIIAKNVLGAKEQEKTHIWGAIYITDLTIDIGEKTKKNIDYLLEYKAELYLKLSDNAEKVNNMTAVTFTENALRIYLQLKDKNKISEIEKKYSEQRGKYKLATIRQDFPREHSEKITSYIKEVIDSSSENQIIYYLINTPWFNKIDAIQATANESKKKNVFMSMLSSSVFDKFGNTIETFHTEEEKDLFNFWQSYGFNFQVGKQTMHHFFVLAYKSGKISFKSILNYLKNTWLNEPIIRKYNGEDVEIIPIDLIKPSIRRIFEELDNYSANNEYEVDCVTITDSLVLKIETLIRNYCEKIGIATFKTRQKGKDKLVMEKLLDDMLADIRHSVVNQTGFDEEDRIFIKYVLSEKAGLNLRNTVAHGLLDIYEYTFSNIIVSLSIVLKISKYSFTEK